MIELRPMVPPDFDALRDRLQAGQALEAGLLDRRTALECLAAGPAWALEADGEVMGCAGVFAAGYRWPVGWALLSYAAGRYMVRITRAVRAHLDAWPLVATGVRRGWREAERWVRMLGFTPCDRDLYAGHRLWLRRGWAAAHMSSEAA